MTIEEWRDVADKLRAFHLTMAAVDLDKYYGEGNEYSKRLIDISREIIEVKLDLIAQLIKEHPDEEEIKLMFPDDEEEDNDN